ncbi:protein FAM234A [Silurus meridionalis]|nr:protein FAM234A [Silurus meridionalis]XP_046704245.1 protein FAM234A [Silurus meridionalis]
MSVDGRMEAEPLKGQQEEVDVSGVCSGRSCKQQVCEEKLSGWRTAAFLISIFISLTVVFAFSFILPCPVRPQYLPTWNITQPAEDTYDFLGTGYANDDKVLDIFIIYKSSEGHMNHTGEDLSSSYLFLLSVDGTNGRALWERPLSPEFDWAECGVGGDKDQGGNLCVVSHDNKLTTIDLHTGKILWNGSLSPDVKVHPPVISLLDLNQDKNNDIGVLSYSHNTQSQVKLVILSGRSGEKIGSKSLNVPQEQIRSHLQFSMANEEQYLLLHTDSGLYALSLKNITVETHSGLDSNLKREKRSWEQRANHETTMIYNSTESLQAVVKVSGGYSGSSPSLLLLTNSTVMLFNTKTLTWSTNTSKLISLPSFGHFNKDGVPDVVLEEDQGNFTKRVVIVDGQTGSVMWKIFFPFHFKTTHPASVLTLNYYSVFMLWGETSTNDTTVGERSSYLLHPLHSDVLLEKRNHVQHIIAFKALLLERGRHACYLVLSREDGVMVLTKRKIKGDVSKSAVLEVGGDGWLEGGASWQTETVKESFLRLRFSDQSS